MRGQNLGNAGGSAYKIEGLDDLVSDLRSLPDDIVESLVKEAVFQAFLPALKAIKARCPVVTGRLRDSLKIVVRRNKRGGYTALIIASDGDFLGEQYYAAMIEYGTHDMPAQPFLRPGFDETADQVLANLQELLAMGIELRLKK